MAAGAALGDNRAAPGLASARLHPSTCTVRCRRPGCAFRNFAPAE
jgi:hypothetical protein